MAVTISGTDGITTPALDSEGNLEYSGTLTGGTGVINIGSGQVVKDANGNVGFGVSPTSGARLDIINVSTRYMFRDNGIQALNLNNTDWSVWHARAAIIDLRTPENIIRFRMERSGRISLLNGSASRGGSGTPITSNNDTVANQNRQAGYIEMITDIGAVGVTYFLSDIRKKDNVVPTTTTTSDLINNINFIEFDWKPGSGGEGHETVGVSAQQLKELDGNLVSRLSDGYYMVNEPKLVTYMAKALQEQIRLVQELREEVNALKRV